MMGPTKMEQITTPAEQALTEAPAETYSPPSVARLARSAWAPRAESPERRSWTFALAATLLVAAVGFGLLYADDTGNQATVRSLATTKADLEHPHLTIWNVPQQVKGSSWYLAGGIPDTFTYHLKATSTGPMSVSILTLEQWAAANGCVDAGRGTTNYCMHHSGAVISWLSVTSVTYDFHLAEGCADYVSVFTSPASITIRPNVSVTYNPASSATGACA